jgi:transposase
MEAGYRVHLAHAPALPQYSGLQHIDDQHDAQGLAHLLRLGLLPPGYIYPKAERAVRDVLRKRSQLVRHKTMVVLSLQSLLTRLTGTRLSLPRLRQLTPEVGQALVSFPEQVRSVASSLAVLQCLEHAMRTIEQTVRQAGHAQPGYRLLQTVPGIGPILALTILLESGDMQRFPTVGALRLLLSLCRQRAHEQWQTQRSGEYEERQ